MNRDYCVRCLSHVSIPFPKLDTTDQPEAPSSSESLMRYLSPSAAYSQVRPVSEGATDCQSSSQEYQQRRKAAPDLRPLHAAGALLTLVLSEQSSRRRCAQLPQSRP